MEAKVRAELSALTENLQRMQDEMVRLADLEGLRSRAESRRMVCTKSLYQAPCLTVHNSFDSRSTRV